MPMKVMQAEQWRTVPNPPFLLVNGEWKKAKQGYVLKDGIWYPIWDSRKGKKDWHLLYHETNVDVQNVLMFNMENGDIDLNVDKHRDSYWNKVITYGDGVPDIIWNRKDIRKPKDRKNSSNMAIWAKDRPWNFSTRHVIKRTDVTISYHGPTISNPRGIIIPNDGPSSGRGWNVSDVYVTYDYEDPVFPLYGALISGSGTGLSWISGVHTDPPGYNTWDNGRPTTTTFDWTGGRFSGHSDIARSMFLVWDLPEERNIEYIDIGFRWSTITDVNYGTKSTFKWGDGTTVYVPTTQTIPSGSVNDWADGHIYNPKLSSKEPYGAVICKRWYINGLAKRIFMPFDVWHPDNRVRYVMNPRGSYIKNIKFR